MRLIVGNAALACSPMKVNALSAWSCTCQGDDSLSMIPASTSTASGVGIDRATASAATTRFWTSASPRICSNSRSRAGSDAFPSISSPCRAQWRISGLASSRWLSNT
ncbi:hypothetical protein D3C71_1959980 [compost metagenome]